MDLSLKNIWRSWFEFKKGKKITNELHGFQYNLENNLYNLFVDLNGCKYKHGGYKSFTVCENKKREISVAAVRDRVVHRLVYDYLNNVYDKMFIYDAWSCRKGKGLLGAIERAQYFLNKNSRAFVWKCDIKKFFDNVDHKILLKILELRISGGGDLCLLKEIIQSFESVSGCNFGMPIGNLTSQIFANIYLNELDRFVKHALGIRCYLRYGDDFIVVEKDLKDLMCKRIKVIDFLNAELGLKINSNCDKIFKSRHGLKFLGVRIWPGGRTLNRRNMRRIRQRLTLKNVSSYRGLLVKHASAEDINNFDWTICEKLF